MSTLANGLCELCRVDAPLPDSYFCEACWEELSQVVSWGVEDLNVVLVPERPVLCVSDQFEVGDG